MIVLSRHNRGPRSCRSSMRHGTPRPCIKTMRRTGFDPVLRNFASSRVFTFPKLRGLSGLKLPEIASASTGVLCPPRAKFLSTFQKKVSPSGEAGRTPERSPSFPCHLFAFRGHVQAMTMNLETSFAVSDEQLWRLASEGTATRSAR